MSLEELAEKLREELIINGDCKEIVDKIRGARHVDGSELTVEEKEGSEYFLVGFQFS